MEEMELIRIDSLPVVEEFFSSMLEPVNARVNEILSLECNEDTKKEIKTLRTDIRKTRSSLDASLKAKKKELFLPWTQVETRAKEILNVLDSADAELKNRIDEVERREKLETEKALLEYFEQLKTLNSLDWLTYERLAIKVNLSDSYKKLSTELLNKMNAIKSDIDSIIAMDSVEILAEYKQSLDLASAIATVKTRQARVEEEAKALGKAAEIAKAESEHVENVHNAISQAEDDGGILTPPTRKNTVNEDVEADKTYTMTFSVKASLTKLKALKEFIINNDIEII